MICPYCAKDEENHQCQFQFKWFHEYMQLPKSPQKWIVQDLIPSNGIVNVFAKPKLGKGLPTTTPILTSNGWSRIGWLKEGDYVFGSDGKLTRVEGIFPQPLNRQCYKVTIDNGEEFVTDAEHWWQVERNNKKGKLLRTTEEIYNSGLKNIDGKYSRLKWRITLPQPLQYDEKKLPIPPYILGAWLGDGNSGAPQITCNDPGILYEFVSLGWMVGKAVDKYGWRIYPPVEWQYGVEPLRTLDIYNNKHIPDIYLRGSVEQRKELLAGLLDTDGYSFAGTAEFYNCNQLLAQQVKELAEGLGCKVTIRSKMGKLYGVEKSVVYTVRIRSTFCPFKLSRKAKNWKPNTETYWGIRKIEPTLSVPTVCIKVAAEDGMFLVGKTLIPTHNTFLLMGLAQAICNGDEHWEGFDVYQHGPVAFLEMDTPREEMADRFVHMNVKPGMFAVADMWQVPNYPFSILDPKNLSWLKAELKRINPLMTVIDTIREIHEQDENDSTGMKKVMGELIGACRPSTIVLISHQRKDANSMFDTGQESDIMDENRGSSYIAGKCDVVIKLTKKTMVYKGRATGQRKLGARQDEHGFIRISHEDDDSIKLAKQLMANHPGESQNRLAERLAGMCKISVTTATRRLKEAKRMMNGGQS